MVKSNSSALGLIFPNSYDPLVPDLVNLRLMASIPFASRYRMIDFVLSSMVNCGIDNVSVIVRKNYHSLMDHLGTGREWDLTRKNGGLHIFPPFAEKTSARPYTARVDAISGILSLLKSQKEKYVVMADTNMALNFNFKAMIQEHIASGADVSIAYNEQPIPEGFLNDASNKDLYYTLALDEDHRINNIYVNLKKDGIQNCSMNIYVIDRELLIDMINTAFVRGQSYFERDVLLPQLDKLNVHGFRFDGYVARITGIKSYFDENMKLLNDENLNALFGSAPIYTKIRDDNPTRYITGAKVNNIMAADGCVIEGEVENSILFRGVKIAKGAKVKNCILMQDTVVEEGSDIEYLISDKNVTITAGKTMKGTDTYPLYIAKDHQV